MTNPPTYDLRVLLASDHVDATSGYSVQARLIALGIRKHCHLALLSTFGLHGSIQTWTDHNRLPVEEGIPMFPGGADAFANDVIGKAAKAWQADAIITLKDTLVFHPQSFAGFRWMPMAPIDHDPPSPQVIERCRASYRPIAYAPHGFRALRSAGLDPAYCPHAYDPQVYYPVDKAEARAALDLTADLFIIGTCAVNRGGVPSRKSWIENLQAFAAFAADKPNVRYFLHTDLADDNYEAGIPLRPLMAQMGILDKVLFCDQERYRYGQFPPEYMRTYYNALDVLNAVSNGEGFGIPTLEAQSVGVPVIVGNWCAHEDLCFGGWKVGKQEAHHFYDAQQAGWVYIPQPGAIARCMEDAYQYRHETQRSEMALAGAAPYQIDTVIRDHWLPLLEEITRDIRAPRSRGVLRIIRKEEVFV
jgi:glycosyltransferase involved in cell wall biosynthesis